MANITFNPQITTVGQGLFNTQSKGLVQGSAYPDPAIRYKLAGGLLATTETLPMWGGVGIYNLVPGVAGGPDPALGTVVGRALLLDGAKALTGFSVFDQAYGMINTPQSPVPLAGSSMQVMYYRLGSGARIAVAMDPALVDLEGGLITQQVSWDFAAQRLIPYVAAYPANALLALSWSSAGGGTVTGSTTTNHGLVAGDDFTISGSTPAGYNGTFTALAGTATNVLKYTVAADPGAATVLGQLDAGGGALPVKVLEVQSTNCMTVDYDPDTGFATWNYNGAAAVILI